MCQPEDEEEKGANASHVPAVLLQQRSTVDTGQSCPELLLPGSCCHKELEFSSEEK